MSLNRTLSSSSSISCYSIFRARICLSHLNLSKYPQKLKIEKTVIFQYGKVHIYE